MSLLVVQNSGAPIILVNITKQQFSDDIESAYGPEPVVRTYTEQSMGTIEVNLMNVAWFREYD